MKEMKEDGSTNKRKEGVNERDERGWQERSKKSGDRGESK